MDAREAAKDKIAKLMAMATHEGSNDQEAETALRQAEAMMRKHGIDAAELQDRTGQKPVYQWSTVHVPAGAPRPIQNAPLWFGWIFSEIGRFTDTKVGYAMIHPHGVCATFKGDATDVEYAVFLCKHLRDDCRRQARAFQPEPMYGWNGQQENAKQRENFKKGYASRVTGRMRALRAERDNALRAVVTSTGTALVIVQQKIALRDAEFGKQTYGRSRSTSMGNGAEAGRRAGDRASFSRPIGSSGGRAQLN